MDNHEIHDPMTQENPKNYEVIKGPSWRNEKRFRSWEIWEITQKNTLCMEKKVEPEVKEIFHFSLLKNTMLRNI